MNIGRIPPEGGGGGDIPLGAEKRRWHHDRASLMFSGYGVPPVRRSPRCAWGWSVAWDAGLPQDALVATQRRNGRAFSSLTARGGGLPVGVKIGQLSITDCAAILARSWCLRDACGTHGMAKDALGSNEHCLG